MRFSLPLYLGIKPGKGEEGKYAWKAYVVMEPEGSSWVDKALGLLVFMVGLAAGARAHKMPQKCFLLLFLYLCCVALRTVPIVLRLEPNGKEMIKCFLSIDKLLSTCNLCGFIVKK